MLGRSATEGDHATTADRPWPALQWPGPHQAISLDPKLPTGKGGPAPGKASEA